MWLFLNFTKKLFYSIKEKGFLSNIQKYYKKVIEWRCRFFLNAGSTLARSKTVVLAVEGLPQLEI